jgi:hypothetical protein
MKLAIFTDALNEHKEADWLGDEIQTWCKDE